MAQTPEQKAQELYGKYFSVVYHPTHQEEIAKQCALIAVDEIIIEMQNESMEHRVQYYQKTKEAILKL